MTRPLLLALAVLLAACEPAPHVVPEAVSEAYAEALAADDVDTALGLLEAQANTGDLHALAQLADVRSRGYLVAPHRPDGAAHLPIRTWPWSGPLAMRRFEAALQDAAAAGDHDALFLKADRHLARQFVGGEWQTPDPAPARELYARLKAEDADPLRLAFLARRLGHEDAFARHVADAADAGQPLACVIHYWETRPEGAPHFAEEIAREIDTIEACQARGPEATRPDVPHGVTSLQGLAEQHALGNADAVALMDSLDALGLFDRHPDLRPLLSTDS